MRLRVTIDGESSFLEVQQSGGELAYRLQGVDTPSSSASVEEIGPGVFSFLLGTKSVTVDLVRTGPELEVLALGRRFVISTGDLRDRPAMREKQDAAGTMEVRAQMPGKVIRLLVEPGARVESAQPVIVVEAMKMQNEMKSPKAGLVTKIYAVEGATVSAGERLLAIE